MKVFVNNIEIYVFIGATVNDAVNYYFKSIQSPLPEPFPLVFDQYGNQIEPDGELSPNSQIFTVESDNTLNYE